LIGFVVINPALKCWAISIVRFADYFGKYLAIVAALGFAVTNENTIIDNAEIITIGTTGMNPKTAVPPGVRVRISNPPGAQETIAGPGAGAGTKC
jgi:hypothetical protein